MDSRDSSGRYAGARISWDNTYLNATAIETQQLRKCYGNRVAVDGLDLDVHSGETFGLLGPNGAGKTTTIQLLTGLLRPDNGIVRVWGNDPLMPKTRLRLGVAPQSVSLYERLTARENLEFLGSLYGLSGSRLRARVDWALELAGLQDRARDPVHTYSGGMKRRLNIAAGLVHEPDLLFLDEPTVGVDPQSRNHILDVIRNLAAQGLTLLYTTHYMEEAERPCSRVAVMDHGRILALDTVPGLLARYGGQSVVHVELPQVPADISLPGTLDGTSLRFDSADPIQDLVKLKGLGLAFREIQITQPDLESVFLALTGRTLRDS